MKRISRVINLLPCPNLDDFPTHYKGKDAESLLANWTAAWHPELIAATGSRPLWCSTEQTAPENVRSDTNESAELEVTETDPYFSDLYTEEGIEQTPTGDHNGPHAPEPYDGSPFQITGQTGNVGASEFGGDAQEPETDSLWQNCVLFIPTVSTSSLHEDFAASAATSTAAMVAGQTDRDEIIERISGLLELRSDEMIRQWADEFYALGYAWLQVQLLTRKIRYSSNLNQTRFDSALVNAALAVVSEDYQTAEDEITTCYDTLMEEKNNYYPVKPDLIDLVLTSPQTLGESFAAEVIKSHPSSFLMSGGNIETLAANHTETLQLLQQRLADGSKSLVGGNQFELPTPLLSKDSTVSQILQCRQTAKRLLNAQPNVFLRRRAGLTSDLPLLLEQLDFNGALHLSLDRGRVPPSSTGTIAWSGPGSSSILAKSESPLDASDAATFLDFSVQFGRQLDSAHSATMFLVHWPGNTQSSFQDLIRISTRSPVLGTFQTLDEHFEELYDPGYGDTFLPDEYRHGYLVEACKKNSEAPISSISTYWKRTWQLVSLGHLNTWIAMVSRLNSDDSATSDHCSSIAELIEDAHQTVEKQTKSWGKVETAVDTQIKSIEDAILELLRRLLPSDAEDETYTMLLNPLGFRRRLAVTTNSQTSLSDVGFISSQKPFQLAAVKADQSGHHQIMDVDSFSAASLKRPAGTKSSARKRQPDVLDGLKLQNEFFVATIDDKTGGLRSIQFHDKRGNRGGQRLVFHDHTRPNRSSDMVCKSITPVSLSKIGGQIETNGSILMEGEEVAEFKQTFRLFRGQRHIEIEIELTPKVSLPASASSWFSNQLAWQEESCSIHAACQLAKFETVDPQIQSPNFVQISMSDYSLTLLAGGLAAHRRTERCRLDTLLIVGNEQQRKFRLGIGVNIRHAARAAIHFDSPAYTIEQSPSDFSTNAPQNRCLLHFDCKNIVSTQSAPLFESGKLVAIRLRLQETEGRAGRLHISTPLRLLSAERQNLLGQSDAASWS
jgi:alpha-mannosidase